MYTPFLIASFMFTWQEDNGWIGCSGLICTIIGFPGAILALLIKILIELFKSQMERKRYKKVDDQTIFKWQQIEEQNRKNKEDKERAHQKVLRETREKMHNSPITKEIVEFILRDEEFPFSIEVKNDRLTLNYENSTKSYIFRTHGLPNMDQDEADIFAEVLNQKLNNKYIVHKSFDKPIEKYFEDGVFRTIGYEHIGTTLELKITRTF